MVSAGFVLYAWFEPVEDSGESSETSHSLEANPDPDRSEPTSTVVDSNSSSTNNRFPSKNSNENNEKGTGLHYRGKNKSGTRPNFLVLARSRS